MPKIIACALLLSLAVPGFADEKKFDAEARAKAVAPYLDEQTIGVGHVVVTRIDVDGILEYGMLGPEEIVGAKRITRDLVTPLTKAGIQEVYVVFSLADAPGQAPFLVIPIEGDGDGQGVREALSQSTLFKEFKFEKIGSAVVGGATPTLARLKNLKPDNRPELTKAFTAAGDTAIQAILVPTKENRRVVEEIMPKLPQELGGGPITIVTHGILWSAVGVDLPPKAGLRAVVQSQDAAAARKLHDLAAKFFKVVGNEGPHNQKARDFLPGFDKLVEHLIPKVQNDRLIVTLEEKELSTIVKPIVATIRERAVRTNSMNNLKQIALAMHNYHDAYRGFPTVANFDKAGKPLLSWRVHLLPFLDQVKLYKEFHLDEPWDSEHNKTLIAKMPAVYQSLKNKELLQAGKTGYLVPVGENFIFTGTNKAIGIRDIIDGTSNTILTVDVDDDHAVVWTKPDDFKPDPQKPQAGLRDNPGGTFLIGLADGSVHLVPRNVDPKILNAFFTRNGGEVVRLP
jgi:hypothetical protein